VGSPTKPQLKIMPKYDRNLKTEVVEIAKVTLLKKEREIVEGIGCKAFRLD
jgi:hypothetical protein